MNRDLSDDLIKWKSSARRKPLILRGARQVGKTHLLKKFGKSNYKQVAYVNFEDDPNADDLFQHRLTVSSLIGRLELYCNVEIVPSDTLIVFDEVQASPRALNSLKFFCENASEYHVAAAGSLLGIKVSPAMFPVGKVDFLNLYPMSFMEFLAASGKGRAVNYLRDINEYSAIPIHDDLVNRLKSYLVVGGMPEAVATYVETSNFDEVRDVQRAIIAGYELDFAKHPGAASAPKIQLIWNAVPQILAQENKKFIYGAVRSGARSRDYENSLQWLFDAGVLYKSTNIETPKLPLRSYANPRAFKVFVNDVGLLCALLNVAPSLIIENTRLLTEFRGALTENYVAQQLSSQGQDLFYWTSSATSEVDFLLTREELILPLEVKAGVNTKSKSLAVYDTRYAPKCLLRANLLNLCSNGRYRNFPLYAIERLTCRDLPAAKTDDS